MPSRASPDPPAIPIDFIRLSVAEVRGFPDLASVERMTRERGAQAAAEVFKEVAHSGKRGTFPAFAPARLAKTTQFFLDLVVAPLLMRTVFGEDPQVVARPDSKSRGGQRGVLSRGLQCIRDR